MAVLLALGAPSGPGDNHPDLITEVARGDPRRERAPFEGEDKQCSGSSGWTIHVCHHWGAEALLEDRDVQFIELWGPDGALDMLGDDHGDCGAGDAGDGDQFLGVLGVVCQDPKFLAAGCQLSVQWCGGEWAQHIINTPWRQTLYRLAVRAPADDKDTFLPGVGGVGRGGGQATT